MRNHLILCLLVLLLVSCEKELDDQLIPPSDSSKPSLKEGTLVPLSLVTKSGLSSLDSEWETEDEIIKEFAYLLSLALQNNDMRCSLRSEIEKRFDGDYDCLARSLRSHIVRNNETFIEILTAYPDSDKTKHWNKGRIVSTMNRFKNLQVSMPVHFEDWLCESYQPLVVFTPYVFDDSSTDKVPAFNSNQEVTWLTLDEEPDVPTIVVTQSERVDPMGRLIRDYDKGFTRVRNKSKSRSAAPPTPGTLNLQHGGARQLILDWTDVSGETGYDIYRMTQGQSQLTKYTSTGSNHNQYVNNGIPGGTKVWYSVRAKDASGSSGFSPIMGTVVSDRSEGTSLTIDNMKFSRSALRNVESWTAGAPEIRIRVVVGSSNGVGSTLHQSARIEPAKRRDIQDRWWGRDFSILDQWWPNSSDGTVLTFNFREEDVWQAKVDFTISASFEKKKDGAGITAGGNVEITKDPSKDGHIHTGRVHWWDPKSQNYGSGFQFNLK